MGLGGTGEGYSRDGLEGTVYDSSRVRFGTLRGSGKGWVGDRVPGKGGGSASSWLLAVVATAACEPLPPKRGPTRLEALVRGASVCVLLS